MSIPPQPKAGSRGPLQPFFPWFSAALPRTQQTKRHEDAANDMRRTSLCVADRACPKLPRNGGMCNAGEVVCMKPVCEHERVMVSQEVRSTGICSRFPRIAANGTMHAPLFCTKYGQYGRSVISEHMASTSSPYLPPDLPNYKIANPEARCYTRRLYNTGIGYSTCPSRLARFAQISLRLVQANCVAEPSSNTPRDLPPTHLAPNTPDSWAPIFFHRERKDGGCSGWCGGR